jgi:hypothetical protein
MHQHSFILHTSSSRIGLALAMVVVVVFGNWFNAKAEETLPSSVPDFPSVIRIHADQLAKIESDKDARNLFVSAIGPALQLSDVARTLGASPLPAKLAKELLVPDLTEAVHRLMSDLSVWHLASTVRQAVSDQQITIVTEQPFMSPQARAWLDQQRHAAWHDSLHQLFDVVISSEWPKNHQGESASARSVAVLERAIRLEVDAMRASYREWDRIRNWNGRVRELRGQARLCGTWQWIIHNHQKNHQEQKLSLLFPPPGHAQLTLPGLVETMVLGENVYLRWEIDGRIQEDSLQFNKEGQRLEGTFVNSQGGWGSISGKKTASCTP